MNMSKETSSFSLSNQFNGFSEQTRLKATECGTYTPLSQNDVYIMQDFSNLALKAYGGTPTVMDAAGILSDMSKQLILLALGECQ